MSDVYLNDIVWRVIISMIAKGTLFNGKLPSAMDKDTFVILISRIADNKYVRKALVVFKTFIFIYRCDAKCEAVRSLMDQLSLEVTTEDLVMVAKVTSLVYQRAANFIAVGIAAILREVISPHCKYELYIALSLSFDEFNKYMY